MREEVRARADGIGRSASGRSSRPSTSAPGASSTTCRSPCAPGEVLGLVALEGQGQETLFDILAGNRKADRGQLLHRRRNRSRRAIPFDVIRKGVVLVPADRLHALLPQRSIRENIAAPLFNRVAKWGPINGREERRRVAAGRRAAVDRHPGGEPGAPAVRRQPAEGHDRPLAGAVGCG